MVYIRHLILGSQDLIAPSGHGPMSPSWSDQASWSDEVTWSDEVRWSDEATWSDEGGWSDDGGHDGGGQGTGKKNSPGSCLLNLII